MEDDIIVELFLKRDEQAIKLVSDKYGKRLRNISFGILNDEQASMECENDTYVEAWNSIPPHSPKEYLYAFLARITRHVSLNCCRERSRLKRSAYICELSSEMEQCIPSPDDCECRIDDLVFADVINKFLASQNTEKRNIFLRRYCYMDSIADISKRYGYSESKVKATLFRSRNQLREHLEKEGYIL